MKLYVDVYESHTEAYTLKVASDWYATEFYVEPPKQRFCFDTDEIEKAGLVIDRALITNDVDEPNTRSEQKWVDDARKTLIEDPRWKALK